VSGLVQVRRDRGREFQILGATTLKLRAPNDVRTNGAQRRLVLESLRERVEWQAWKDERRLRKMKSTESDVYYFEVNAVFNREPVELLEESTWTAG